MYGLDETVLIGLSITGVTLAAGAVYLLIHLTRNVFNPMGKGAHRKTLGTLKRFAGIRRFKVLSDVRLEVDGKTVFIENLLIGFFGILLVHTLGARGGYYGTLDGENWYIDQAGKRITFANPVRELKRAEALLRSVFAANKLYKIPIESVVCLTSKSQKTELYITHNGEILMPGRLGEYLGKTKFEKDIGLDVEAIAKVIAENDATGRGALGEAGNQA